MAPNDPLKLVPGNRQDSRSLLLPGVAVTVLLSLLIALADEIDSDFDHRFQAQLVQVQTAALNYHAEYGRYPTAPDNATLIKILTGASPDGNIRGIQFLALRPSDADTNGEMLGPLGTPVQFSVTAAGKLHACSAGPDKIFGTGDDIAIDDNLYLSK